ncbi:anhydro-N-acetylmuramic acid kinase [uncultured Winogradskyella sp.]|uniref:anhydro-N-acetylmuramic acid kinase n=1 Tax=uncultured Winogradskyella sp. TaxID=395353 RepID=UPI002638B022|nr:anhydro-N-acetylmuramic acid kinase [uncultured Winogradskyella sp.]
MLINNYCVVSVMSGTSLDGIDILYSKFSFDGKWNFKIIDFETISYSLEWKQKLKTLTQFSKTELNQIDSKYSEYLANQVLDFINSNSIENIDFIASHGHTALHNPGQGYTYQIGNRQIFADILKQKVICDFRVQDVGLGGQGAPLVPIGDKLLFGNYDFCINLGGFANISFEKNKRRIAFDICPVNIVLNHYVNHLGFDYDDKGKIAQSGTINFSLLEQMNDLSFYKQSAPKSLGLEWVKETVFPLIDSFNLETKDTLKTIVEHIAVQITKHIDIKQTEILITGGGAYNSFLIERIEALSKSKIIIPDNEIVEYKEALIFGLLGVLKDRNEVNCLKSVTGAKKDHSSGKIFNPKINV